FGPSTTSVLKVANGAQVHLLNSAGAVTTVGTADFADAAVFGTALFDTGAGALVVKVKTTMASGDVFTGDQTLVGPNILLDGGATPRTVTANSGTLDISHPAAVTNLGKEKTFFPVANDVPVLTVITGASS